MGILPTLRPASLVFALMLLLILPLGGDAAERQQETQAQRQQSQPYNNAPVWREVRSGREGYTSTQGRETGVLIHSWGETWRELRNTWIVPIAGWLFFAAVCGLGLFWRLRGPIKLHDKPVGRMIRRFSNPERVAHWTMAISFCILGLSGLTMMVGKYVLLPVIGYTLFSWLAEFAKFLHNLTGPVFAASIVLMIVVFIRHEFPGAGDLTWLLKGGGILSGELIPCGKFNAGHKVWFWGSIVFLSTIVSASGLVLDFPNFDQTRLVMILANITHSTFAGLLMALSLSHIYMGTVGVEGAYEGMRYGYVDETYAKEHHEYWYQDVKSGKIKADSAEGRPEAPLTMRV